MKEYLRKIDPFTQWTRVKIKKGEVKEPKIFSIDNIDQKDEENKNKETFSLESKDSFNFLINCLLQKKHQKIFKLYYEDGLTFDQISKLFNCTESNILITHKKCLENLKKCLLIRQKQGKLYI